jgi:RecA-family ATPase
MVWVYRDPTEIPPREWVLGTTLLRGYASILGSMGGVGKTAYAIALALAFITGRRDMIDQHVFQSGKAWFLTLEDDREELQRRIAAAMIAHDIAADQVGGRLFINTASERPLLLARAEIDGTFIVCEDVERLVDGIKAQAIGLTIIDPLVKSHAVIENSNEHMDRLIGTANDIARATRSSVLLATHFRKGGGDNGTRDAIRGGSALIDGARIVRTLMPMTEKEAEALKIAPDEAFRYVRVHDAKANLAPKGRAAWFELVSIPLGNREVNPTYPAGDNVQAAKVWKPPNAFDSVDRSAMKRIFARLRGEPEPGWFYSPESRAKFWAGTVIIEEADKSRSKPAPC